MSSNSILILLATVCSLLPMVMTRSGIDVKNLAPPSLETIKIADTYSFRHAYQIHAGCYRWCWLVMTKVSKAMCYTNKETRCKQKKNFSYANFIVFHLSKYGLGKLASTVLGVPDAILKAGLQAGTATFGLLGGGALALAGGVGNTAVAATNVMGAGTKLVAGGLAAAPGAIAGGAATIGNNVASGVAAAPRAIAGGAATIGNNVASGVAAAPGAIAGGAVTIGNSVASGVAAAPGAIAGGAVTIGSNVASGVAAAPGAIVSGVDATGKALVNGVGAGASAIGSGMTKVVSSPAKLFRKKGSGRR